MACSDGGEQRRPTALLGPYHRVAGLLVVRFRWEGGQSGKVGEAIGPARRDTGDEQRWIKTFHQVQRGHWNSVTGKASARCESRGNLEKQRAVMGGAGATGEEREENRRALESEGGPRWSQARILSG